MDIIQLLRTKLGYFNNNQINENEIFYVAGSQSLPPPLEAAEEEKLNTFLNTASDHDGNGNCNGQAYSYTAGQKPKDYLPEACWAIYRKNKIFLEQEAKDKFINEKIAQEC